MKYRVLGILLTLCMVLSLMPSFAIAAETVSGKQGDDIQWTLDADGVMTVSGTGDIPNFFNYEAPEWQNYKSQIKVVKIESGVLSIGAFAFADCENLRQVEISDTVSLIHHYAFARDNVSEFRISENNTNYCAVDDVIFSADMLTLVICQYDQGDDYIVPNGVTTIGPEAFTDARITGIVLPEGLSFIDYYAFDALKLDRLYIPDSVKEIANGVFFYTEVKDIYYGGSEEQWQAIEFGSENIGLGVLFHPVMHFNHTHSWNDSMILQEATSTEEGLLLRTCSECGAQQEESIPPVKDDETKPGESFSDVETSAYYAEPVAWAVANGITSGIGNNCFAPDMTCTRAQVVTFLWRAKGSPEPTSLTNPFADVSPDAYYYKAVLWAVENNITQGTGNGKFSPDAACTRGQVVTFLWRTEGNPEETSDSTFADVANDAYYAKAVQWAVARSITQGTGGGLFSPDLGCTRAQIVTFLYRDLAQS